MLAPDLPSLWSAVWFLPPVLAIGVWVSWSDMKFMKIPNTAVLTLAACYLLIGPIALPFDLYLWGWALGVMTLVGGFVTSALRLVGAGDAKFAAAMAPFFVGSSVSFVFILFGGCLLGARLANALRLGLGSGFFCGRFFLDSGCSSDICVGFGCKFGRHVVDDCRGNGIGGVDADVRLILQGRVAAQDLVAFDVVFLAMLFGFRTKQRLTVGKRDLVVVGVNFGEGQEAVAVAAVVNESGLQRGLDPRYFRQIDVAAYLLLVLGFEVEFFNTVTANDDNARLFFVRRVD